MDKGKVEHFLKQSLVKLGLDYVDLYLIHMPVGFKVIDHNKHSSYYFHTQNQIRINISNTAMYQYILLYIQLLIRLIYIIHILCKKILNFTLQYVDDNNIFPLNEEGQLMIDYTTDHIQIWKVCSTNEPWTIQSSLELILYPHRSHDFLYIRFFFYFYTKLVEDSL